jgi:hypothetical protein
MWQLTWKGCISNIFHFYAYRSSSQRKSCPLPLKARPTALLGGRLYILFFLLRSAPQIDFLSISPLSDGAQVKKLFRDLGILPLDSTPFVYLKSSKSSWNESWHAPIPHPTQIILRRFYLSKPSAHSYMYRIITN